MDKLPSEVVDRMKNQMAEWVEDGTADSKYAKFKECMLKTDEPGKDIAHE